MKDLKLHTPNGLNDLLPAAYQRKRAIKRQIEAVFESYGYTFVSSPALEYLAVFDCKGSIPSTEMYKFVDRNGDMLALRPDMTPAVARMAASHPAEEWLIGATGSDAAVQNSGFLGDASGAAGGPLRLCYIEKAFRHHERYRGRENEFTQAGAELLGVCSAEADAEIIALAVQSLLQTGLQHFRIDIGQVDFLPGIAEAVGLSETSQKMFMQHMFRRDYVAAEKLVEAESTVEIALKAILTDLTQLTGADVLTRVLSLVTHPRAVAALRHLEAVYAILCDQNLGEYICLDLSMTGQLDYYTGIIFKGYAKGTGATVADGGRYDHMLAEFDKEAKAGDKKPAVGFGIKIDGLLDALSWQNAAFPYERADTLLAYAPAARAIALQTADNLRKQGLRIENSLQPGGLEALKAYALQRNLKGIVYFAAADKVLLANLETGADKEVSVDELLQR